MCKRIDARVECYTCGYPGSEACYLIYSDGMCRGGALSEACERGFPDPGCWKESILKLLCRIGIHQWKDTTVKALEELWVYTGKECRLCLKEKFYA